MKSLIYEYRDYKEALRDRAKFIKNSRPQLTLQNLAKKISIQYTYLSKVLNSDSTHLGEDHLYSIGQYLEYLPEEIDFLLLLRSYQTTENLNRKENLFKKIESIAKSKKISAEHIESSSFELNKDLAYLFNPICQIIQVSLFIKDYKSNPRLLGPLLGLNVKQLKEYLKILENSGYIKLDAEDPFKVLEIKKKAQYFTKTHPLMRAHQSMLKDALQSRLTQTLEENKESFMVTFTMDEKGFEFTKLAFDEFIKKVQSYTFECHHTNVYQICFDFLRWY